MRAAGGAKLRLAIVLYLRTRSKSYQNYMEQGRQIFLALAPTEQEKIAEEMHRYPLDPSRAVCMCGRRGGHGFRGLLSHCQSCRGQNIHLGYELNRISSLLDINYFYLELQFAEILYAGHFDFRLRVGTTTDERAAASCQGSQGQLQTEPCLPEHYQLQHDAGAAPLPTEV